LVDATNSASRGSISAGTTMGDLLGAQLLGNATANAFSAGLGIAVQATNFSALLNFLETQGNVHVLSSPRIATLNNQKAVLKVGSEESFVTNISGGSSVVTNGTAQITPPTLSYQPFFSGISLDVTPQIDENDNITLHVRTMVNSIAEKEKLAIPATNSTRVPFAVNSISETDSVVKTRDAQVVVIGGLMTESTADSRSRVPLAGDVPVVGALFGRGDRQASKRELVILLKTTVVKGDETWAGEISAAQGRVERMNAPATRSVSQ
jgi:MSHA biogenesis protein MshL